MRPTHFFIPFSTLLFLTITQGATAQQPSAPELLLTESKDPLVRESAAQILGQRGDKKQSPALITCLSKEQNIWVRARCAEALGLIGNVSAIPALRANLARETDQRVRRMISQALVRLGQSTGVDELTWQLKTGTNYSKAEVMEFLVAITGQPLGQTVDWWMSYLREQGNAFLSRRPSGSPSVLELRGIPSGPEGSRQGPCLVSPREQPAWQQTCATVINLAPSSMPVTQQKLQGHLKKYGPLADHCLILIQTGWLDAQIKSNTKIPPPALMTGITEDAARFLLEQAPHLKGVGIDAPSLDFVNDHGSARAFLLSQGRLVFEGMDDLDLLHPLGTRLLVMLKNSPTPTCIRPLKSGQHVYDLILLGILP